MNSHLLKGALSMRRFILPAFVALAALAGAMLAQAVLAQEAGRPATIIVRVPPDATLKIGSQATTQKGFERRFVTPDLVAGYSYSYELQARWTRGSQEFLAKRRVDLQPGQTVVVDLQRGELVKKAPPEPLKSPTKVDKKPETKAEPKPLPKGEPKTETKKPSPQPPPPPPSAESGFVSLFNGKDLSGWKTVPEKADKTFTVKDSMIVVSGNPNGYFYTDKSFQNYILKFDWRYKRLDGLEDESKFQGNSGLLVHIQEPHKVWPKCIEVQGMNLNHGMLIPVSGAKLASGAKFDKEALTKARHKVGEWNTTEVTVKDGAINAKVNGAEVSSGNFDLPGGPFGFQSEGAELHFKNIVIKTLPASAPGPKKAAPEPEKKPAPEPEKKPAATPEKKPATTPEKKAVSPPKESLVAVAAADNAFKDLFNGKDLSGWKAYMKDEKADPSKTFVVKDGEIQVSGEPFGYIYTDKSFKSYVIRYDWTYPKDQPEKTTMNSGLLLHMQSPNKIWPKSVEAQGRYKDHGKFFFIGFDKEAKKEDKFDQAVQQKALKPAYEWNTTEATCKADGTITVRINGVLVNEGKSELTEGPIGLQSEGARIHFRNIKIKPLQ
jgi:uncharacterized protein (TIGR03000 family)